MDTTNPLRMRRGIHAGLAAMAILVPTALVAATNWHPLQEVRIDSTACNQVLTVQFAQDGGIYGHTSSDVTFGHRAINVPWSQSGLTGTLATFLYDYGEGRYTAGYWGVITTGDQQ